jgi:hypothetical protein
MALHFLTLLQDEDGNGEITAAELRKLLGQVCLNCISLNLCNNIYTIVLDTELSMLCALLCTIK